MSTLSDVDMKAWRVHASTMVDSSVGIVAYCCSAVYFYSLVAYTASYCMSWFNRSQGPWSVQQMGSAFMMVSRNPRFGLHGYIVMSSCMGSLCAPYLVQQVTVQL